MTTTHSLDVAAAKSNLRNQALSRRDALDGEFRINASLEIAQRGAALDVFSPDGFFPGTCLAGFHPIRSEIDPRPLMAELAARGARLCLPVVMDKTTIEFRELVRGGPLIDSGFGSVGPPKGAAVLDPDILLVPLSAFDRQGGRIGYGAGFYDRAISRLRKTGAAKILLGIAFSCQEVETVPMEPHDVHLHGIITETELIQV